MEKHGALVTTTVAQSHLQIRQRPGVGTFSYILVDLSELLLFSVFSHPCLNSSTSTQNLHYHFIITCVIKQGAVRPRDSS